MSIKKYFGLLALGTTVTLGAFASSTRDIVAQRIQVGATGPFLTLPSATDQLVGRATTDTLTNKTLTSPVISNFSTAGVVHTNSSGVLTSSLVVNADIGSAAGIAVNKLAALTASRMVSTDASGFLISVANLNASGNTILAQNSNGYIQLSPAGTGYAYVSGANSATYPTQAGLAFGNNFSNTGGESDLFNANTSATVAFDFYQQTGASAGTKLLELSPTGGLSLPQYSTAGVLSNNSSGAIASTATLSTALGGLGVNAGAATGVPLIASGTTTITATIGTGNIVRAASPTFSGTVTAPILASASSLTFQTNGTTTAAVLDTSQNATITGKIATGGSTGNLAVIPGTTGSANVQLQNTGGSFFVGLDNSTGSGFATGAYGAVVYNGASTPLSFFTSGVKALALDSNQNATFSNKILGTSLHNNGGTGGSAAGSQAVASGTYTPTVTNGSGASAITPSVCQWIRVGNVVTVSGLVNMTLTVGANNVTITLPTTGANFGGANQAAGSIITDGNTTANTGVIFAVTSNVVVKAVWTAVVTATSQGYFFHFTYQVI